jgi:hypothetical protein
MRNTFRKTYAIINLSAVNWHTPTNYHSLSVIFRNKLGNITLLATACLTLHVNRMENLVPL